MTVSSTIDVNSTPVLNLDVNTIDGNIVSNAYVYDVGCQLIPITSADGATVYNGDLNLQTTRINIAVMAEGYTGAEITDYINYANNAFASTANFHFGMTNDFFERYINDFNFVRYDTISLQSGIDTETGRDDVYSILDYNDQGDRTADMDRIKAVMDKSKKAGKCGLDINNVDAVIVLVNTNGNTSSQYFAHTWSFDDLILHNKYSEPVHYAIVSAPVGNPGATATNAIAHELGHAMGSLSDEYTIHNDPSKTCNVWMKPWARNITNSFFGTPITSAARWDAIMSDYGNAPNYPVGYEPGGNYCDRDYFRPTVDSTMRFWEHSAGFVGVPQFGPLNTYYMYGTYLNRINPANTTRHVWSDYYNQFKTEWPASSF